MLNALRHQRMNHQQLAYYTKGVSGAQRLAASTNESPCCCVGVGLFLAVLNALRHQRMNHLSVCHRWRYKPPVLNALRHQRMNHWRMFGSLARMVPVLNALRHQRMNHMQVASRLASKYGGAQRLAASTNESLGGGHGDALGFECSTPCGINE